jgi:hypothetical protein
MGVNMPFFLSALNQLQGIMGMGGLGIEIPGVYYNPSRQQQ